MSDEIILRDYQLQSVDSLRAGIRAGHRCQVLVLPTGAGKTVVGSHLLNEVQRKGTRAGFIVDRVALVEQTSRMLWGYGITHGVAQSDNTFGRQENIQVCSAQTLEKRGWIAGDWNLAIVDECHTQREFILEYVKNTKAIVIGLTATPFAPGMGLIYTNLVNATTTNKLIQQGYLAPLHVYAAVAADMTGAKTRGGEWTDREAAERGKTIVGDIVSEWIDKTTKHFGGPVKTIAFSATVDHGEELCKQFQAAGFRFEQVSYKDGNDERRAALIKEFRESPCRNPGPNDIAGLVSVEALAKGFDVPDILCGISARPYRKSFTSHIQQIGRAMRASPETGKEYALWLDHTGNYLGFLPEMENLFEYGVQHLDDDTSKSITRREVEKAQSEFVCRACGYVLSPAMTHCPACGHERPRKSRVQTVAGEMRELLSGAMPTAKPKLKEYLERDRRVVWAELCYMARQRKGDDLELATKWARQQYHNLYDLWPGHWPFEPAHSIDYRLESHVRANLIRYAKRQERRRA